jgi:MinD-like ATPase involved in chromosome partitioning or flagellar assembly
VDGTTARAGVPVALPPRPAAPAQYVPPMPQDLPHAPESAWAQPPSSQYPMVGRGDGTDVDSAPRPQIQPLHGVPHQVPPAPMPRAPEPEPARVFIPPPDPEPMSEPPAYWPQPPAEEPAYHYDAEPEPEPQSYHPGPHQLPGPAVRPITAEEFARRRAERRPPPLAERGLRGALRKSTFGLINPTPGRREQEYHADIDLIRRNFGGLRQVTVVNPKGGAGKTVAVLMLAMTFGQRRGGYVLAWDNNETQGTLGMRAQQDFHARTVRDLLSDLHLFQGAQGRVGDLSQYVRAQGEGMFEVLASDESATAGEMLTEVAFGDLRDVVSRFYKIIVVDTGNNVRAPNWQAAVDATDQLVVTMSARNDSAETAARMLDHLEQTGRVRAVRQAVTVISMPQSQRELDVPGIERHFAARTRAVLRVPYERIIDTGEPIAYGRLSTATADAWLRVAAAVAAGL